MNETLSFFRQGLTLVVYLSLAPLLVAVIAGVLVSLVQTMLSLQDQALPFSVKLIAVGLALALVGPWIGGEVLSLGEQAMQTVSTIRVERLPPSQP
jgi:type III secretion protein S